MKFGLGALLGFAALTLAAAGQAQTLFTAVGKAGNDNVNTSALFTNIGGSLQIVLTSSLPNTDPGGILTGLVFDISQANPALSLTSGTPAAGSQLYATSTTAAANQSLLPGWGFAANSALNGAPFEYGIAASGENGAFAGGLGNESYGIVGPGTDLSAPNMKNKFPIVKSKSGAPSSATFVLSGFGGLSTNQITDVRFAFGSAGLNILAATVDTSHALAAVPEPGSLALFCGVAVTAGVFGLSRRRRK